MVVNHDSSASRKSLTHCPPVSRNVSGAADRVHQEDPTGPNAARSSAAADSRQADRARTRTRSPDRMADRRTRYLRGFAPVTSEPVRASPSLADQVEAMPDSAEEHRAPHGRAPESMRVSRRGLAL